MMPSIINSSEGLLRSRTDSWDSVPPIPPGARVHSLRLRVERWRCWPQGQWELAPGVNALIGPNGAGKTSLVEALSVLSPGRGLRQACPSTWTHRPVQYTHTDPSCHTTNNTNAHGFSAALIESSWRTGLDIMFEDGTMVQLETGLHEGRRKAWANGAPMKSVAGLGPWLRLVWPLEGLAHSTTHRRVALNRLIFAIDPGYGTLLTQYDKALRQRHALFAQNERNTAWHTSVEHVLARTGWAIAHTRYHVMRHLDQQMQQTHSPFACPDISLHGALEDMTAWFTSDQDHQNQDLYQQNKTNNQKSDAIIQAYAERLERDRPLDSQRHTTHFGPHRTRVHITHPHYAREIALCSRGEQTGLLMAITLATIRLCVIQKGTGTTLLLLDEIMAHLDPVRQKWLWEDLIQTGLPVVLTGLPDLPMNAPVHVIILKPREP